MGGGRSLAMTYPELGQGVKCAKPRASVRSTPNSAEEPATSEMNGRVPTQPLPALLPTALCQVVPQNQDAPSGKEDVQMPARDKTPTTPTLSTEPKGPGTLASSPRPASRQESSTSSKGAHHLECPHMCGPALTRHPSLPGASCVNASQVHAHLVLTAAGREASVTHPVTRRGD